MRASRWVLLCAIAAGVAGVGCKITPEEIQVIETENELLREQISLMKEKCDQSRELELRLDEDDEEAPKPGR